MYKFKSFGLKASWWGWGLKTRFSIAIIVIVLLVQCERKERYYRPNLPEKLCSIGIIDLDDTLLRHISFEKSFQIEYPEEVIDSLRELSFTISSSEGELFKYQTDSTLKNLKDLRIPDSIEFNSVEKYYLRAKEKSSPEISAEVIVPQPPSKPSLISINWETTTLSKPQECTGLTTVRSAVISFSFINNSGQKQYYALLLEGTGFSMSNLFIPFKGLLDFSIRESNSPGFFAVMPDLKMYHYICDDPYLLVQKTPVFAYFIEGRKIPNNECRITLSAQFADDYCVYDFFKAFRIKVLSIPEELYLFEKSLYTYNKTSGDPFAEQVYFNGNIKGGNGVFAICRSTDLTINLSSWY
jgi:hypothetical protein